MYSGDAGTGKTYSAAKLIDKYINKSGKNFNIICYTAANSKRLRKKYHIPAQTSHKFMQSRNFMGEQIFLKNVKYLIDNKSKVKKYLFIDELGLIPENILKSILAYCQQNNITIISTYSDKQIHNSNYKDYINILKIREINYNPKKINYRNINLLKEINDYNIDDIYDFINAGYKLICNNKIKFKLLKEIDFDKINPDILNQKMCIKNIKKINSNNIEIQINNSDIITFLSNNLFVTEDNDIVEFTSYEQKTILDHSFIISILKGQGAEFDKVLYLKGDTDDIQASYTAETRAILNLTTMIYDENESLLKAA
jgi:hypothetical protein